MKYIVLVGDGMGDYPHDLLDGLTPLESARTHAMDRLSREGELFLLRTVPEGYPPGSDVANLSLLGYRPEECYTGRAPFEAASMGVELAQGQIAFRCNLVTLEDGSNGSVNMVDYSAGHISTEEAGHLIRDIDLALGSAGMRFYPGISYRHLMVLTGELKGLETVPPHDYIGQDVREFRDRYLKFPETGKLFIEAEKILRDHEVNRKRVAKGLSPASSIWLWGEGRPPVMKTIPEIYGISGALISAVDLLKGIGRHAGLEIINVPGATGYLDTNYAGKAEAALAALERHDLVFVHVEAPDEVAHQGLLKEKITAIEDFDSRIVKPVLDGAGAFGDFRLVVAMDHYTPVSLQTHIDKPVPLAIYDSRGLGRASGLSYSEKNADKAANLIPDGRRFFEILLEKR